MNASASTHASRRASGLTSVGAKLASSTIVLILAVTAGVYLKLSRTQRETLLQAKEMSAAALTRLFVDSCGPGVEFGDDTTVAEELVTLGRNDDVEYAAVWGTNETRRLTKRFGELRHRGDAEALDEAPLAPRLQRRGSRVVISSPIFDRKLALVGATIVAFSLTRENQAIASIERTTLLVSTAVAIGLLLLLIVMARIVVVGPLRKLVAAANELEHGGKGEVDIRTTDEVGHLASAFRRMAIAIRVREERIGARNRDMRLVLDNVGQGFITLDVDGTMSDERSRVVDEWFGVTAPGAKFWELLGGIDASAAQWFELGWGAVVDDVLPLSLCLEQLPKLAHADGRAYELAYRPILEDKRLTQLIVVITDVTTRIERQRAEQAQREMMSVFRRQLSDRSALDDFFAETTELIGAITRASGGDDALLKRQVHTVKGNTAMFGIESVAAFCHQLEDKMAEAANGGEPLSAADLDTLNALWGRAVAMRAQFNEGGSAGGVELGKDEHRAFLEALGARASHEDLRALAITWRFEPVAKRLAVIGEQVRALASRLGRASVEIVCEPTALRLPPARWSRFWSVFAHVVRNTVDHGIETTAQREAAHKAPQALVTLSVRRDGQRVVVSISDDGPGIDWTAIASRARERGLPHASRGDLEAALFADGISARGKTTSTSGRGVGLSALREVVLELHGRVEIESTDGRGTTFRFVLPESMLVDAPPAMRAEAGSRVTLAPS